MDRLFLTILNMSLTGAFVIAAICLARLLLKKAPKIISYCLWAVAGFRLVFPFSIESVFSLIPFNPAPIPLDIAVQPVPRFESGISFLNEAVSGALPAATVGDSVNPLQIWTFIGSWAWIIGAILMLVYGVLSYIMLKRKMRGMPFVESNIYESETIKSPFVLGVFMPKIYLPSGLSKQERGYIILHEQTHIKRCDHIVKFAAYFILCLHWFNPLAWVAFLLMGVDMEMSCDERVLKDMGSDTKKDYSLSLLSLATERRVIGGSPLAFGEGGVKERIKRVLNFKKPSRVIITLAVALVAVLSIGFASNRVSEDLPFKNLKSTEIASINLFCIPPNVYTTINDRNTIEEIAVALRTVVKYEKDDSGREYSGQLVQFTLMMVSGDVIEVGAYNPFITINGEIYRTKYEPCERLNALGNRIINNAPAVITPTGEMRIFYEQNPAYFLPDMKLLWGDFVYHVTHMRNSGRGAFLGIADDEYSTWQIYELQGYGHDYVLAVESDDVWRVMSAYPPKAPWRQYILENATEKQRMERLLSVTLHSDGTAHLATPLISSFMLAGPYYYSFENDELRIGNKNNNIIESTRFEQFAVFTVIDDNTIVFKSATVPLFADAGARYVSAPSPRNMTLDDVRAIAQTYGTELTLNDLRGFNGVDVGSGLIIPRFSVDDGAYYLMVGAGGYDSPVAYAYFSRSKADSANEIDIRYYDVDRFIADGTKVLVRPLPEQQATAPPAIESPTQIVRQELMNGGFNIQHVFFMSLNENIDGGETALVYASYIDSDAIFNMRYDFARTSGTSPWTHTEPTFWDGIAIDVAAYVAREYFMEQFGIKDKDIWVNWGGLEEAERLFPNKSQSNIAVFHVGETGYIPVSIILESPNGQSHWKVIAYAGDVV